MIHLARKKRQLAREQGEESFIPLDDTQRVDRSKSRLVREDDNDKSDDDDERLDFSVDRKEKERRHIETTILAAAEEGRVLYLNSSLCSVVGMIRPGLYTSMI
jgi:GC-rich sequence DNA-binding factor